MLQALAQTIDHFTLARKMIKERDAVTTLHELNWLTQ
jgi:hypothetical protein